MSNHTVTLHDLHSGQLHIIQNRGKRTVIRAGRRFGKTTLAEDLACQFAINSKQVGWFAPKYKFMQGSFRRMKAALKPIISRANATEGIIELITGGFIRCWTLEDEDCGRGDFYHEVIIDEASLVKKRMQDILEQSIAPTLIDKDGNAWMAGTPKGIDPDNFFYFACTNTDEKEGQVWKEFHAPTSANPTINAKALAEFKAVEILERRETAKKQQESENLHKAEIERQSDRRRTLLEVGEDKYDDFEEVVKSSKLRIAEPAYLAMLESDISSDLVYYLAKNDAEADRISDMSPYAQAKEIGKLEDKLAAKQPIKKSDAPKPITPVNGSKDFTKRLEDMTIAEYEADALKRGARWT